MTILASDIKLLQSERMTDAADGGGRMTSSEVLDGVAGSLFPKVSRLDAVYGRVNIRKIYAAVMSGLAETYGGAHAIITDPPDNPRISCVLFSTASHFDTRAEARNRIESYVVGGTLSRMRLYGNQIIGQRSLLAYQRPEEVLPDVGDTLCLSVEAAGYTPAQQYVRIDDVDHDVRTFTDTAGDFERRVIRLKLTTPLQQTFTGAEPSRYSSDPSPTKIRDTTVADSARYFGIRPLVAAATAGDVDVELDTIYSPIVPGTQRESPVSNVQMASAAQFVQTGPETTLAGYALALGNVQKQFFLPTGAMPGSIKIPSVGGFKDNGDGTFTSTSFSGVIDYEAGRLERTTGPGYQEGSATITYAPAMLIPTQSHTESIGVTLATRGLSYTRVLDPMPGAGSLTVDYRAMGKWYRLRDDGAGKLSGASPAEGVGQVSYTSGAVVVTLGALPDVGSSVILTWASPLHFSARAGATADNPDLGLELHIQLPDVPVKPDSVSIAYNAGGPFTMVDNASGIFAHSGTANPGATASVDYATGLIVMRFVGVSGWRPATSSLVTVTYEQELAAGGTSPLTTTTVAVTTPAAWASGLANMAPKSVRIERPIYAWGGFVTLVDNGSGGLVTLYAKFGDVVVSAGQSAGTVNYTTGDITLTSISASGLRYEPSIPAILGVPQPGQWVPTSETLAPVIGDYAVTSKADAVSYAAKTHALTISDVGFRFDLTKTTGEAVVPGSVWINFSTVENAWAAPVSIFDRGNGSLYAKVQTATGVATEVGSIDYTTGVMLLRDLPLDLIQQVGPLVRACLTARGQFTVVVADFRTPGSPLRPASFYVQATSIDGVQCTGTADANGVIAGSHLRGTVDASTGVAHVEFGDVVSGVWVPREVFPATIRFSCITLSNLALDPTILGLDPVRLPSDGRVPVVRQADVAVIHHTAALVVASPAAGAAIDVGRTDLAVVEVRDADGQRVPADRYSVDLGTGVGAWADPLVTTGHPLPWSVRHRIEEMVMVADAQISGVVSFSAPLLRDYPAGSWLSTALLAGDMVARVENVFDQQSWTGVWADSVTGSAATAELNTLQYPIQVANDGAIKERWRAQIKSLSPLTVDVYGEGLGMVGTYPTSGTIAPVNPLTGKIYWAIQPGAWGAGNGAWAVGNVVRWNTVSAAYPITVLRTILSGAALTGDAVYLEWRGDVD